MSKKNTSKRSSAISSDSIKAETISPAISPPQRAPWRFALPFFLLALLRFLADLLPPDVLWGLSVISYLPDAVSLVFIALGIIVAVPAVASRLTPAFEVLADRLFPGNRPRAAVIVAVASLCFGAVAWVWPMPYPFLGGDGVHVVRRLFRFNIGALEQYGQLNTEFLTVWLYALLGKLSQSGDVVEGMVNITGYTGVFRIVGAVSGALFVAACLSAARKIFVSPLERLAIASALIFLPGTVFFLGYVELYLIAYLFGAMFLLGGVIEISRDRFPVWSTVSLVCAIAFHVSAAAFVPAYGFVLHSWYRRRAGKPIQGLRIALIYLVLLPVLGIVAYLWLSIGGRPSVFIPGTAEGSALSLLSGRHLLDLANNLLLLAPASIASLILIVRMKEDRVPFPGAVFFALIASLAWFGLCASQFAFAHDWDIFAPLGLALGCAGVLAIVTIRKDSLRRYLLLQCILQPLFLVVPWIAVHLQRDTASTRYADMSDAYIGLLPDETVAGFYETLRSAAAASADAAKEVGYIRRAIDITDDPYEYVKLLRAVAGSEQLTTGMVADITRALDTLAVRSKRLYALPLGEDSLARSTTIEQVAVDILRQTSRRLVKEQRVQWAAPVTRRFINQGRSVYAMQAFMGNASFETGDLPGAIAQYRAALADTASATYRGDIARPFLLNRLAISLFQTGDRAAALSTFRAAVALPDASVITWSDYGFACYQSMEIAEAATAFQRVLSMDPNSPVALYCLGKIQFINPARRADGIALLRRFTAIERGTERARDAEQILRTAGGETQRR